MSKNRKSNSEFVLETMEFSNYGGMAQLVIMAAIDKYVTLVSEMSEEEVIAEFEQSSVGNFISPSIWRATCMEIKGKLNERLV